MAAAARSSSLPVRQDVRYGPHPGHLLDLYRPAGGVGVPAIVMIHGGGWRRLDKTSLRVLAQLAAKRGVAAASIDYRLVSDGTSRWPAQIIDVQLAVRWLRANAAELNVDPDRIGALGFSAGAHLAVFAGVAGRTIPGDFADELNAISSAVCAVVSHAGPVDLTDPDYPLPSRQLLGNRDRDGDKERDASPLFLIDGRAPPMLVVHGHADHAVPIEQSKRLVAALQRNGVPVQVIFHAGSHGTAALPLEARRVIAEAQIAFLRSPLEPLPKLADRTAEIAL